MNGLFERLPRTSLCMKSDAAVPAGETALGAARGPQKSGGMKAGSRQRADDRMIVLGLGGAVIAAGGALQAAAIEDADHIASRADQAFAFELVQGDGDARAPHAEQQGEEVVRDAELVIADAVVPHQQTAGGPFVDLAATGGDRGVVALHHEV